MNEIATPQEFSDICPFSDAQFKEKMKELVAEDGFKHAVTWVMPDIDFDGFCKMLLQINTKKEFQENVMFDFLKLLAAKTTEGISYDNIEKVDQNKSYTMMTNHRDIVLDASFLNLALLYNLQGSRIHAVGVSGLGDVRQQTLHTLNFSAGYSLNKHFNLKLQVNDLLNRDVIFKQDVPTTGQEMEVERYRKGTNFEVGISYNL